MRGFAESKNSSPHFERHREYLLEASQGNNVVASCHFLVNEGTTCATRVAKNARVAFVLDETVLSLDHFELIRLKRSELHGRAGITAALHAVAEASQGGVAGDFTLAVAAQTGPSSSRHGSIFVLRTYIM